MSEPLKEAAAFFTAMAQPVAEGNMLQDGPTMQAVPLVVLSCAKHAVDVVLADFARQMNMRLEFMMETLQDQVSALRAEVHGSKRKIVDDVPQPRSSHRSVIGMPPTPNAMPPTPRMDPARAELSLKDKVADLDSQLAVVRQRVAILEAECDEFRRRMPNVFKEREELAALVREASARWLWEAKDSKAVIEAPSPACGDVLATSSDDVRKPAMPFIPLIAKFPSDRCQQPRSTSRNYSTRSSQPSTARSQSMYSVASEPLVSTMCPQAILPTGINMWVRMSDLRQILDQTAVMEVHLQTRSRFAFCKHLMDGPGRRVTIESSTRKQLSVVQTSKTPGVLDVLSGANGNFGSLTAVSQEQANLKVDGEVGLCFRVRDKQNLGIVVTTVVGEELATAGHVVRNGVTMWSCQIYGRQDWVAIISVSLAMTILDFPPGSGVKGAAAALR